MPISDSDPRRSVPGRRRGITMVEVLTVILLLGVIVALAVPSWKALRSDVSVSSTADVLRVAQSEGRRVAGLPGNHYRFPDPLVSALDAQSIDFTSGPSTGDRQVSVFRHSATQATYAALVDTDDGTRCLVLADTVEGEPGWGAVDDPASCDAMDHPGPLSGTDTSPEAL